MAKFWKIKHIWWLQYLYNPCFKYRIIELPKITQRLTEKQTFCKPHMLAPWSLWNIWINTIDFCSPDSYISTFLFSHNRILKWNMKKQSSSQMLPDLLHISALFESPHYSFLFVPQNNFHYSHVQGQESSKDSLLGFIQAGSDFSITHPPHYRTWTATLGRK